MTSLSNSRIIIGARTCGKYRAEVRSPLERAGKTTDMAESKAWTTKRKMKARSAKLVATRQARASAETHRRAVDPTSHAESHTSPSSPTESVQSPSTRVTPVRSTVMPRRMSSTTLF